MTAKVKAVIIIIILIGIGFGAGFLYGCGSNNDKTTDPEPTIDYPVCTKPAHTRVDAHTPVTMVADWGPPIRLGDTINTPCPEDAIEISSDGHYLYFMFTEDRLEDLTPEQILSRSNNTYRATRIGGPGDFDQPVYYDLAKGTELSLDGELSFTPDGSQVYFHSNRPANLGYQHLPPTDDYLDIYVADISGGVPGPGVNLGAPVNSIYPDGEHAIHPDGETLYLTSLRPGGLGGADIYWTAKNYLGDWLPPENLAIPINSFANDLQPTFTPDGDTMYFTSDRNIAIGSAIYRSVHGEGGWSVPEVVIQGVVGEASLTADGHYLYFVHVLTDTEGTFDADIWYCER